MRYGYKRISIRNPAFSIHDGDGIRSNVFLKGCPLRCLWCHNPEGLTTEVGIQYIKNKCRGCGKCGYIFKNMHDLYIKSEDEKLQYARKCLYGALEPVGKWMSVKEVIDDVMKDLRFSKQQWRDHSIRRGTYAPV